MKIIDWEDYVPNPHGHTVTGTIKIIERFPLPQLNRYRRIWIYLPPGYEQSERGYPVLYMHDGQNLFDMATSYSGEWQVDESLNRLCQENRTTGAIVVGIDNGATARFDEYIPGYSGDKYAAFIVDTLKPFIDSKFCTLPDRYNTGTAGSSLGGLISLYMGFTRPDVFSRIGAFSPAMHFAGDCLNGWRKEDDMRIYLDVGTRELLSYNSAREYADFVWDSYHRLICAGFSQEEVKLLVEKDAEHNEADWARRFPEAFLWLFG
ncbi:Carbohydrate esterase family 1 protein (fragment) [uncultured Sporomusa sp.]|uniref:Carbohydrate esterase family 1 protein n=1 Tax=uncultured Sporomusa sp. TaxID=307249 RepID=A0A212LZA6_9FIRM